MDRLKVAVGAISWARSDAEARLVEDALRELAKLEIPVFVVDGGSPADFVRRLRAIEGISVFECAGPGLQSHVIQSLELAAGTGREFVLYTESDKKWFFQHRLADFLELAPDRQAAGVVLPARTPDSFATFPEFQRYTETVINTMTGELLGRPGEYTYGPRLIRSSLTPHLRSLGRDLGWGWQAYVLAVAQRSGYSIVDIELDIPCPAEQRNENGQSTRLFRVGQLSQHLAGLSHGLTQDIGNSTGTVPAESNT